MDESHAIDMLAEVREELRNHLATAPPWSESEGRLHHPTDGIGKEAGVLVKAL